jgi:N-acyl-D-amino-acid deacylase
MVIVQHREGHLIARLVVAALTVASSALPAMAQAPGYNPYTGRGTSRFNAWTQPIGAVAAGYNPYTGAGSAATQQDNPLTGTPPATQNPLTGRYGRRVDQRQPPGSYRRRLPVTGKAGPGLEHFDDVMLAVLEKHGIPGGALALVKDGKLVLARGYGWGNLANNAPVEPHAVFAVASLSKTLLAVAVLKLVEQGKLKLEDRAFRILSHLKPPQGARVDPRQDSITIRQCLIHSGGWDRNKSGEPWSYSWRVARRLLVPLPINTDMLTRYMRGERLDFTPGTQLQYSNYGYTVLGQVVEKLTGMSHSEYVGKHVLKPMGLLHARLPTNNRNYANDEVRLYSQGTYRLVSPDYLGVLGDAAAGWRVSAVDLARFLSALDGSRTGKKFLSDEIWKEMLAAPLPPIETKPGATHPGLGWDVVGKKDGKIGYFKDGRLPGSRTFMGRTPAGVNYVVLFNSGEPITPADINSELHPRHGVEQSITKTIEWPDVDYFDLFK